MVKNVLAVITAVLAVAVLVGVAADVELDGGDCGSVAVNR